MAPIDTVNNILQQIRKRHTSGEKPRSSESILTIEEICTALIEREGFTGSYEDLVKHVRMFFGEMSHQLSDGYAVNTGYFSVHPVVEKRARRRRLAKSIVIDVDEQTDQGYIEHFTDTGTGTINDRVTPGRTFVLTGHKIKIDGNNPECGAWFVFMVDPSLRFKVTKAFAENSNDRVSGIVPVIPAGKYLIEIKTQYSGSGVLLKEPRTIRGAFTLRNYKILTVKDDEQLTVDIESD
jgi:hypothetical protein